MTTDLTIITTDWQSHKPALMRLREQVFINEQHVPVELEWDELDAEAVHLLATHNGAAVGCARVVGNQIGRMAVLMDWRNHGVGMALLDKAVQVVRQHGFPGAKLSAQTHAIGFYQKVGFQITSEPYLDANILHVDMQLLF